MEGDLCRDFIRTAVVGIRDMLRNYYQTFPRMMPTVHPHIWPLHQEVLANQVSRTSRSPANVNPMGWSFGRTVPSYTNDQRLAFARVRMTWAADQVLLPRMQQWVARLPTHTLRVAWTITLMWSVPMAWRAAFIQLISAFLQAPRGRLTRQAVSFMRTALQVAKLCGYINPALTTQVFRLERLSRWNIVNIVATPLRAIPQVWLDGRREVGSAELMGAQFASYVFHDEQQGYSQTRRSQPALQNVYTLTGTYHPVNYLLQFAPRHSPEAEEVD